MFATLRRFTGNYSERLDYFHSKEFGMKYLLSTFFSFLFLATYGQNEKSILQKIEIAEGLIVSDPKAAQIKASEQFVASKELGFDLGSFRCHLIVGRTYIVTSEFNLAMSTLEIAHDFAKKLNSPAYESDCFYYMGLAHYITGDMSAQLDYQKKAFELRKDLNDPKRLAESYHAFGNLHLNLNEDSLAENNYLLAMDIRKTLDDKEGIAGLYNNLALIENKRGNVKEYHSLLRQSISLNVLINNQRHLATNYGNLGVSFLDLGELDSAWLYTNLCYEIRKKNDYKDHLAGTYCDLGDIKYAQESYGEAIEYYRSGIDLAKSIGGNEWLIKNYRAMARTYEKLGDLNNSSKYTQKANSIEDSLAQSAISEDSFPDLFEEEEEPIEPVEKEATNYLWYYIASGAALLVLFFVIYQRRKQTRH